MTVNTNGGQRRFSAVFMHKYLTVQNTECKRGGSELVDTPQSLYSTALPTWPIAKTQNSSKLGNSQRVANAVVATRRAKTKEDEEETKKRRGSDLPVGGRPPPFQLFQGFAFCS